VGPWLRLRAGRLAVHVHVLLPAAVVVLALLPDRDLWLRYLLLLGTLFLHELAHALACLVLGGRGATVRLWPVFGRADVDLIRSRAGAAVPLAGPAANLAAAGLCAAFGGAFDLALGRAAYGDLLLTANLLMGAGNLLPIHPLDGGRALRALGTTGSGGQGVSS
jgi:stage IV sporulation protein FB